MIKKNCFCLNISVFCFSEKEKKTPISCTSFVVFESFGEYTPTVDS
jgi:hypothetical protein